MSFKGKGKVDSNASSRTASTLASSVTSRSDRSSSVPTYPDLHTETYDDGNLTPGTDPDIALMLDESDATVHDDTLPPAYETGSVADSEISKLEEDVKKMFPAAPDSPVDTGGRVEISLKLTRKLSRAAARVTEKRILDVVDPGIDMTSKSCPKLNIVIFIVGSRGDVQPYIALALGLIRSHGHRVRLATHGEFERFVLDCNSLLEGQVDDKGENLVGRLEFFDAGGDPRELMAYMVKNPGLMPGVASICNGDIAAKKKMTATYIKGFYNSTFFPDRRNGPFAADAIISNPPAFAHIHVAQALGIPLHMSFTMPWTPTLAFAHPLVTIKESNAEPGIGNLISYHMAEALMWQGLGLLINKFRTSILGLDGLVIKAAPQVLHRPEIPWTYCWSEALIPKPKDWRESVDISGFYFLEGTKGFTPDTELVEFLQAGPPPIYIGFGSVPVKDPAKMTQTIFEGVQKAGVRALVSAGWGGLGGVEPPPEVFILKGSIPHDWLFADGRVSAVCHHGGAGTTAIGLSNGLPTIVVPFFGDQQFWGDMISRAGAGPHPIPPKRLTPDSLAEGIQFALSDNAKAAARKMGETIRSEDGVQRGVDSFHAQLPLLRMRCDINPDRPAYWWHDKLCLQLSGGAAVVLHEAGLINLDDLKIHHTKHWDLEKHDNDPGLGMFQGVVSVLATGFSGVAELFYAPGQGLIDLTWGLYAGTFHIIHDFQQGLDNIPGLIGSDTRTRGPVTGWKSGFKEAGLGLGYGLWDGVTGLVTEPYVGAKQDGTKGLAAGFGRGLANLIARPGAGALGLATIPFIGMAKSVRRTIRRSPEVTYRQPRLDLSHLEASKMSKEEISNILDRFKVLKAETKERIRKFNQPRHRLFLTGQNIKRPSTPKGSRPGTPQSSRPSSPIEGKVEKRDIEGHGRLSDNSRGYSTEDLKSNKETKGWKVEEWMGRGAEKSGTNRSWADGNPTLGGWAGSGGRDSFVAGDERVEYDTAHNGVPPPVPPKD